MEYCWYITSVHEIVTVMKGSREFNAYIMRTCVDRYMPASDCAMYKPSCNNDNNETYIQKIKTSK
jgi:hypothetical protein